MPQEQDGQASTPLVGYRVAVTTADRRGAGTDANVRYVFVLNTTVLIYEKYYSLWKEWKQWRDQID